jgi:hypothetical protein
VFSKAWKWNGEAWTNYILTNWGCDFKTNCRSTYWRCECKTNCKLTTKKGIYVLKDEKQVLGLWCVVHTSCVDQKGFAKQGLDLD